MTQTATVNRLISHEKAEVTVCRQSACGHNCADCSGCSAEGMAHNLTVTAHNLCCAGVGDTVVVESESSRVLGMAFVIYLLPLALFLGGCITASSALHMGEGGSLIVGFICTVPGFLAARLLDRRVRAKRPMQFRIVEVLKRCSDILDP